MSMKDIVGKMVVSIGDIDYDCTGEWIPYQPAVMYLRNGDPGYPEEGGYYENLTVMLDGVDVTDTLSDKDMDAIQLDMDENPPEEPTWEDYKDD